MMADVTAAERHYGCHIILDVTPAVALVDDVTKTRVSGLSSHQPVTLTAVFNNEDGGGGVFVSYGHYVADAEGAIDLDLAASSGGSYRGKYACAYDCINGCNECIILTMNEIRNRRIQHDTPCHLLSI